MEIKKLSQPGFEEVWQATDPSIGFNAFIAIHSTKRGPAIGGVRFRDYPSEEEALQEVKLLAEAMTYKAAVSDLACGGGKGVIMMPGPDCDRLEIYRRFAEMINQLEGRYITATDVGTTLTDVAEMKRHSKWVVGAPSGEGGAGDPSPITALGVVTGIKAVCEELYGHKDLSGLRAVVQGLGSVGSEVVNLLCKEGCELWGSDIDAKSLLAVVERNVMHALLPELIYHQAADILVPCALGQVINEETIPQLKVKAVAGAANNQLNEPDKDAEELKRRGILYAPDFVINAGGLIHVFEEFGGYDASRVRQQVAKIGETLTEIFARARAEDITTYQAAHDLAQDRLK